MLTGARDPSDLWEASRDTKDNTFDVCKGGKTNRENAENLAESTAGSKTYPPSEVNRPKSTLETVKRWKHFAEMTRFKVQNRTRNLRDLHHLLEFGFRDESAQKKSFNLIAHT